MILLWGNESFIEIIIYDWWHWKYERLNYLFIINQLLMNKFIHFFVLMRQFFQNSTLISRKRIKHVFENWNRQETNQPKNFNWRFITIENFSIKIFNKKKHWSCSVSINYFELPKTL